MCLTKYRVSPHTPRLAVISPYGALLGVSPDWNDLSGRQLFPFSITPSRMMLHPSVSLDEFLLHVSVPQLVPVPQPSTSLKPRAPLPISHSPTTTRTPATSLGAWLFDSVTAHNLAISGLHWRTPATLFTALHAGCRAPRAAQWRWPTRLPHGCHEVGRCVAMQLCGHAQFVVGLPTRAAAAEHGGSARPGKARLRSLRLRRPNGKARRRSLLVVQPAWCVRVPLICGAAQNGHFGGARRLGGRTREKADQPSRPPARVSP